MGIWASWRTSQDSMLPLRSQDRARRCTTATRCAQLCCSFEHAVRRPVLELATFCTHLHMNVSQPVVCTCLRAHGSCPAGLCSDWWKHLSRSALQVAGAHIVMLGSYAPYGKHSAQRAWLQADLATVDRARTPWCAS